MENPEDWLAKLSAEERHAFDEAWLCDAFTEEVCRVLETEGMTRAELAARLDVRPAYVTQVLRGKNVSLRTVAKFARALGRSTQLKLVAPREELLSGGTWRRQTLNWDLQQVTCNRARWDSLAA